ncbi:MAG TPA: zinc ribbon domain-containing protein [Pyrinomonadaceae bacterium]|nr:zinc ribbon domain-containing protein [Pyrinomonadaceae bacterium]
MYCPSCGSEERQLSQFCRACGTDLRIVRNSLENPDAVTQSAISAREHIGMAVADKIRQMSSAKDLERVAEDVLPHFEKFLESPEEKRLRRIRSGIITAAIGLGATIVVIVMAMDKSNVFPYITPALITFLVGLGVIVNGLLFTVPHKTLPGDAYDALSQRVLDSGANANRLPYEAPAAATLPAAANLTNELAPGRSQASITEHTTHHLNTSKP